jgi:hypothetical protein
VKGKWTYLYRGIDKHEKPLDFMLSIRRAKVAARLLFRRAIKRNGVPKRIVIDKSGANIARIEVAPDPKAAIPVKLYISIQTICELSSITLARIRLN